MDDVVCAVGRNADLRRHARLLHQMHEAVVTGHRPPASLRAVVSRSWARMTAGGIDPEQARFGDPAGPELVEHSRRSTPLAPVLDQLRASLASVAEEAQHLMVITDADGMVLWREGCARVRRRADAVGFTDGADWSEAAVGTNAIGTALVEGGPVQLFSAEHFTRSLHSWTCTASPVHDPRTGDLLGVVDVSGSAATVHPATVALVSTAVRLAEAELWRAREMQLESLRTVATSLLSRVCAPAMVVDHDGWVAGVSGIAPTDRVALPVHGELLAVPGVGTCLPEQVPGGWLLRAETPDRVAPRLRLDTESRPPHAVVEATTTWRYPLTLRHLELLTLLMRAGRAGMDAAALSEALFGDREHVVTVRSEVSRLRRHLGGLLLARPYRIAPNVVVEPTDAATILRMRHRRLPRVS